MKLNQEIAEELRDIAPILSQLDRINLYAVEDGYFQAAQLSIIELVNKPVAKPESVLAFIEPKELYLAPEPSYFECFSDNIISHIHADEVLEELSYTIPVIQMVKKKQMYEIPATYFGSFPEIISSMAARESVQHPPVLGHWSDGLIALAQKISGIFSRPIYSFATASMVGIIVCVGLVVNNNTLSAEDKIFAQMQQIPDADLHHYVAKHRDEFDEHTILHDINNLEFTHYFHKPEQVTPHIEDHIKGNVNQDDELKDGDILD